MHRQVPAKTNPAQYARIGHNISFWERMFPKKGPRVYTIAFDLDTERLGIHYPGNSPNNAYEAVNRVFSRFGFHRQRAASIFGNESVTPVTCVMAVQAVQKQYSWFGKVVSDIRMLRIEEHNDLMPAIAELELDFGPPAAAAGAGS